MNRELKFTIDDSRFTIHMFKDREGAGKQLAVQLEKYKDRKDALLYALPRGGVVVGKEVAEKLNVPLDVLVVRKIGSPYSEEYAIGAYAETGDIIWNEQERKTIDEKTLEDIVIKAEQETKERVHLYRQGKKLPSFKDKTIIIIDDGVATGLTMRAAIVAAKSNGAKKVIIAVPHGARDSLKMLREEADEVICLTEPYWYYAVGQFYESFPQTTHEEVIEILKVYGKR